MQTDRDRFLKHFTGSDELLADLDRYAALLEKWQGTFNLIGPTTLETLWTRHFLDSLQVAALQPLACSWVDLGSGAGFPGLVLGLVCKERGGYVSLVESNGKKAAFLQTVSRETHSPVTVYRDRLENVLSNLPSRPDVITARALAPLLTLLNWCEPLLKSGSVGLFHKGKGLDKELEEASRYWDFKYEVLPSVVEKDSHLVRISGILSVRTA